MIKLFNWFLRKKPTDKKLIKRQIEGMSVVEEFSDGSILITTNKKLGLVNGKHYTDYVEQVKILKREERHIEAINLLMNLVNAVENESKHAGKDWGVAPWYYEQLAIIYRKEKRYVDEVAILERYGKLTKAPSVGPSKLSERLIKAKSLLTKEKNND